MNEKTVRGVHWSFWAIGVVALLWNVMGGINFFMQMNAEMVSSFPETHRAIIEGRPVWATAGFAVAVFGGALGCILLLLRKSTAFYLFIASLLGVFVTMIHTLIVANSTIDFSIFEMVMMILMPLVVAALLIWFSKQAQTKGWVS
ncbi:MAG: hypothetical protein ACI9XC_000921 [Gammaproteobacteria bacterium]|jgi:hypothetical protein